jgi:hypothetical protein
MHIMNTIKFVILALMLHSLVYNKWHEEQNLDAVYCERKISHVKEKSMKFKLLVIDSWAYMMLVGTNECCLWAYRALHNLVWSPEIPWCMRSLPSFLCSALYTQCYEKKLRQVRPVLCNIFNTLVWFSWVKITQFDSCLERIPITYHKLNFMPLVHRTHRNKKVDISHSIPWTSISASNRWIHY